MIFWLPVLQLANRAAQSAVEAHNPSEWSWEPTVIVGVALLGATYLYAVGPLCRRYAWADAVNPWTIALFLLGSLLLFLSLVSPLEVLSDEYLFSAHMVQHIVMTLVVPPLWLLGTPEWLLRPVLRPRAVARVARVLTFPVAAFLIFNVNFWLWHLPALYDLALADERVHILQHLTFLSTAILNWWPVLSPLRELPRAGYPLQVLYLFANCQPNVALGAIFVFARDVLYQAYVTAPRLFDLSPHADQQIGGLIMWIPGNGLYLLALSIVFIRWFQGSPQSSGYGER